MFLLFCFVVVFVFFLFYFVVAFLGFFRDTNMSLVIMLSL